MNKKTIFFLLAAVSAVILGIVWSNCNVETDITELKTTTDKLFDSSMAGRRTTDAEAKIIIDEVNATLTKHRYVVARPALKPAFDAFVKAWAKAGALDKKMQAGQKLLLDVHFEAKGRMEWNQLFALFLDWLIWLVALGLCFFSDILRDLIGDGSKIQGQAMANLATGSSTPVNPPYSLARTQLVTWITIIGSVYIYAILWDAVALVNINSTALILMGISAGTFATGAILDTSEIQQGIPRTQDQPSTNNLLQDILSDNKGISVHRFQNVIWTIIAIIIYFYRYANPPAGSTDVLPVLDSTLLALTGISSATYLMMKTRENIVAPEVLAQLTIRLKLSPASTLAADVKAALQSGGFPNAVIVLTDQTGNTIHPVPDAATPNFNFNVLKIPAGAYTITVNWSGIVPAGAAAPTTFSTSWKGQLDKNTPNPLEIVF